MERDQITRYVRPEDIPLLDRSILEPIVAKVAKEMAESFADQTVEEWVEDLQRALLRGDILIVIDDIRRRIGIVRTDEPPFSGIVDPRGGAGGPAVHPVDPLNLEKWERGELPPEDS